MTMDRISMKRGCIVFFIKAASQMKMGETESIVRRMFRLVNPETG